MNRKVVLLSALFVFLTGGVLEAIETEGTLAGVYVKNPPTLIIDDWDDGVPPNNLGAGGGSINPEDVGGTANEEIQSAVALGGTGYSLQINYDVSESLGDEAFSGYWTKFHHTFTKDLSDYNCLSFYVKGESGGEFFKIELSTGAGGWKSKVYINDYLDGGVSSTTWQKVVIPFDNFANVIDWTKIYEFTIVFEGWAARDNGSETSGTIYVDNLVVSSDSQAIVRVDHFGDKVGVNSTGGNMGDGSEGGGSCNHVFVSTQFVTSPNSLEINYDVSDEDAWAGIYSIVGGTSTGWGKVSHDFSDYDQMSFSVKASSGNANPGKMKIELKCTGNSIVPVWIENIQTSWKPYVIPFSSFEGLDNVDYKNQIDEWIFVFDNSSSTCKTGTVYIDDVQFEDSFYVGDSTYPATPENLRLMDTATGTIVTPDMEFGWINWLTVEADNGIEDPTLESVRFEYRPTSTEEWITIGYDYDVSDKKYSAYWDTTELSEVQTYKLRAVARDTSKNESEMPAKTGLTVKHYPDPDDISTMDENALLELIQKQIFWYFWTETNPEKGLVQDRARNFEQDDYGYTSVAATGLGLVAICIAHERGWISRTDAYYRVCDILKTYFNAPESSNPSDPMLVHHNGFFYHYTNFGGARAGGELSTIDTAIFAAGALYAGQYFINNGGNPTPWNFAEQIYKRIDWDWMRGVEDLEDEYLEWGWTPEGYYKEVWREAGFYEGKMGGYSECILAYILGIGSPESTKKLGINGWNNLSRPTTSYRDISYVFEKALFANQYPMLFINFKGKRDNNNHVCYAANTFKATIHHHRYCYDNQDKYSTYSENSWGLGGADGPDGNYHHYGIEAADEDGTVALSNLFTAITECPQQVIKAIRHLYNEHESELWGKYTFCDSYNTQDGMWRTRDVLGVQQGAVMLAIENYRNDNSIRNTFTGIDYIQDALEEIGFEDDYTPPGKITELQASMVDNQVVLNWTAPGDDDYANNISSGIYEIRFSTDSTDDWNEAPDNYLKYDIIWSTDVVAITSQSRIVHGLPGNTTYYFWIRTADDSFNWSDFSDKLTFYNEDTTPPAEITNLSALTWILGGEIKLSWTAPGDDGISGQIANGKWRIRWSTYNVSNWESDWENGNWGEWENKYSLDIDTSCSPMTNHSYIVTGLIQGATYFFRIWTADEVLNWSNLSNGATAAAKILDVTPPAPITDLSALTWILGGEIKLSWTAPGDDSWNGEIENGEFRIEYSTHSDASDKGGWSYNSYDIKIPTTCSPMTNHSYIVTGLIQGATYFFRIWTADEALNWSGLSNGATEQARELILWDDCDSRVWYGDTLVDPIPSQWYAPVLTWVNFDGRNCLKANWTQADAWLGFIRTDWVFSDENWGSSVTGFKADVYVESAQALTDIILEPKNHAFGRIASVSDASATNLTTNVWHSCSWAFAEGDYNPVAGFVFKIDNLGGPATVYIDNLRLITLSGDEEWDDMDDSSRIWTYGGDFVNWNTYSGRKEPITHNYVCPASSAASIFLQWDATISEDAFAKVTSGGDLGANWSGYKSVSAMIRCSSTNNNIRVSFWDGSTGASTDVKQVSTADGWIELQWNLPSGIIWTSVDSIEFIVETGSGDTEGTIYIDHISFSKKALP